MEWTLDDARRLAEKHLSSLNDRWIHSCAVGTAAEDIVSRLELDPVVACAAWLHDIGYAESAVQTGLHALDGARLLAGLGAPTEMVSLVAYHSGAEFEAQERDLLGELEQVARPQQVNLDALTLADLTTSPTGRRISVEERLAEITDRYESSHPVHRAVLRSRSYLAACAERTQNQLQLADERLRASL